MQQIHKTKRRVCIDCGIEILIHKRSRQIRCTVCQGARTKQKQKDIGGKHRKYWYKITGKDKNHTSYACTLDDVAAAIYQEEGIRISKERVRQIENKAIMKLRMKAQAGMFEYLCGI